MYIQRAVAHARRVVLSGVLLAAWVTAAAAQPRPDFSGEWVLNRQESTLPPPVSAVESGAVHRAITTPYGSTIGASDGPSSAHPRRVPRAAGARRRRQARLRDHEER